MEKEDRLLEAIRKKTRLRFLFAFFTVVLYGSFVLAYLEAGFFLRETIGNSSVTGALVLFWGLILIFLLMEYIFISLNKEKK